MNSKHEANRLRMSVVSRHPEVSHAVPYQPMRNRRDERLRPASGRGSCGIVESVRFTFLFAMRRASSPAVATVIWSARSGTEAYRVSLADPVATTRLRRVGRSRL